ncbi:MAG TPA: transposase [Gemmatimonadales bacterium]
MPRHPRVIIPHVPLHITQRGVDRCATFITDEDFAFYLWALRDASIGAGCAVHGYVLMTNHVHLLLTPADHLGPARLVRSLGRRYVRYFNDRYRRTGTLWEGRYRSAVVDSVEYFFACSRYIETNPLRAGLVDDPGAYVWSSYHHNACGADDPLVLPHPLYMALGNDRHGRCGAYRALFAAELASSAMAAIRTVPRERPALHATTYQQAVEAMHGSTSDTGIRVIPAGARSESVDPGSGASTGCAVVGHGAGTTGLMPLGESRLR